MTMYLIETTPTTRRELAQGTDRNALALIAQCEYLHKPIIRTLVETGHFDCEDGTCLDIEERDQ